MKNRILEPNNFIQWALGIISFLILMITFSCEEDPSELGSNLIPPGERIEIHYDTTLTFTGSIYESEPMNTSNLHIYSLGIINDENFGLFKGEFIGQFLPYIYDTTIVTHSIDSAVLYLAIDSIYGDPFNSLTFDVFELNSKVKEDASYLSNTDISSFFTTSNIVSENSTYSGDTLLRITLTNTFIDKLTSVIDSTYKNPKNFKLLFNGLAIVPNMSGSPGGTVTANLSSANSKIVLYYNDTLKYNYIFSTGHGFAKYTNDYSSSGLNDYLTNPESENDDLLFLQGLNGVSSKITLSNIKPWIQEDSLYSILKAELFIPVFEDDNVDLFYPPERLFLRYEETDSSLYNIQDYEDLINKKSSLFDGHYDNENHYYHFFISKHLMNLLNGDVENPDLDLNIINNSILPHRVILQSSEKIKLKVTYTKH